MKGDPPKEDAGRIAQRPRPEPTAKPTPPSPAPPRPRPAGKTAGLTREEVAAWLTSDDPILRAEGERRMRPRPPAPTPPRDLAELLARIREAPGHVAAAAEGLARSLDDRKSWRGLHAACRRAWEGTITPEALLTAWREATNGRARVPGAVFMTVLRRESRGRATPAPIGSI